METAMRAFHTSENGDEWLLVGGGDNVVSVRHLPNAASGGQGETNQLGAFLMRERHSAQNQALQRLLATLVTPPPEAARPIE